ncbi:FeoC-like transcriptional regulator [Halodesulfurarchaeum sp. HSR-GB]|uniref:FeoC-like transcriptional regulator n=1 Tax=Halodesulfurarchaeum sp. HSR-GB TaxID=3074077 RepID=UPI002860D040|nr:FeoC-like transcriptional regulator [Halodesulfurarchaeum sp. HSR-GB]MDR5656960.1 FeoC-like transcriptional regulator [Halodesulfurarchaeum sp. HSR-GB]
MNTYRTVLERIHRGHSLETVSSDLDVRPDALRGMVESMLREGHLRELGCVDDSCDVCPMSASCPMGDIQGPTSYMVTEQGTAYLQAGQSASD